MPKQWNKIDGGTKRYLRLQNEPVVENQNKVYNGFEKNRAKEILKMSKLGNHRINCQPSYKTNQNYETIFCF